MRRDLTPENVGSVTDVIGYQYAHERGRAGPRPLVAAARLQRRGHECDDTTVVGAKAVSMNSCFSISEPMTDGSLKTRREEPTEKNRRELMPSDFLEACFSAMLMKITVLKRFLC